jgi:hypothetical protein
MLRLRLSPDERAAAWALHRDYGLSPADRDRVEMMCPTDADLGAPTVTAHLRSSLVTVRRLLRRFPDTGVARLRLISRPARREGRWGGLEALVPGDAGRLWVRHAMSPAARSGTAGPVPGWVTAAD